MNAIEHSAFEPCNVNTPCGLCFNNIVIPGHQLVFMVIPKCASQSLLEVARGFGLPFEYRSNQWVDINASDFMKITVVRNPFDRLVSCWKQKIVEGYHRTWQLYGFKAGMDFKSFASVVCDVPYSQADKHFRPYSCDLIDEHGKQRFDALVKLEHLPHSWHHISGLLEKRKGFKMPVLPVKNRTTHMDYWKYYDDQLISDVSVYYRHDLEPFDYEFEICH